MAINKKRDFKRLSLCIQDFLKRLPCNENTGFLRDTLFLSLLELHKYYIKEKERQNVSLKQTNQAEKLADAHEHIWEDVQNKLDKYDNRWQECNDGDRFVAAIAGNVENLKKNILKDTHDVMGRSYLMYAIHGSNGEQIETIQHFLSLHFNINHQAHDGSTALHVACQHQKTSIATLLLKNKASINTKDNKGRSALHWAARCQSIDLVKLLLQYGADINVQDCDGMTPAMWACYFNRTDNLHVLRNALERVDPRPEAILDQKDQVGRTVLHWAAMTCEHKNSFTCLKELLAVGDVGEIRDNLGRTVLHTGAMQGSVSACQLVLSTCHKDILNLKDNENQTALHLATLCGHGEMVDFLLQQGANSSVENKNQRTALQEAEIGHFHYCLLVFVSFDQMKEKTENKVSEPPLIKPGNDVEKKSKGKKRYESWVIPSTSLNESHDVPMQSHNVQLVDVTEIDGFEINGDVADTSQNIDGLYKPAVKHDLTTEKRAVVTYDFATSEDCSAATTDQPAATTDNPVNPATTTGDPVLTSYDNATSGKNTVTRKRNKNALLERSDRVGDTKEVNKKEKVMSHKNEADNTTTFLNEGSQEEELQHFSSPYSQQHDSSPCTSKSVDDEGSMSENIEISSLIIESDEEKSEGTSDDIDMKNTDEDRINNKGTQKMFSSSTEPNQASKGNLAPIKPLQQPTLALPAKLDPIPLLRSNKKTAHVGTSQKDHPRGLVESRNDQSRAMVSPLQPPVSQKRQSGMSFSSKDNLQHPTGSTFVPRGPGHGPLAKTHSKGLLNSVFKENPHKISEQKTPELQRRNDHPGKLSRPSVRH